MLQPSAKIVQASIEDLAKIIARARREVAALKPDNIKFDHIMPSHDELDAVVLATEEATNKIMDECEAITALTTSCSPETAQALTASITRIFEACNFQDITGQRITKVVNALKQIDYKIDAMLRALGEEAMASSASVPSTTSLLNGPQLPKHAPTQAEIDQMFGEACGIES
ncbi:MAG TPA: protein phosphatase CheZ [Alphaproteobacteria bacterium]|nr:protein phosphatase CheZ [Alphaproteobacteria bacterium]